MCLILDIELTDSEDELPTPAKRLKNRESKEETERRHRERLDVQKAAISAAS
jgi:hypothetical protein